MAKFDIDGEEPDWKKLVLLREEVELIDEEISKEKSLTLKLENAHYRTCSCCGKVIPRLKSDGVFHNLAHRTCYEKLIEKMGSDKYFLKHTYGKGC